MFEYDIVWIERHAVQTHAQREWIRSLGIRQHCWINVRTRSRKIKLSCNVWNAERMHGGCQSPVLDSCKQTRQVSQLEKRPHFSEVTCHFWFLVMLGRSTSGKFTVWSRITQGEPERRLNICNLIFTKTFPVVVRPGRVKFTTLK